MLDSFSAAELMHREIPPIRWIVDGLLPQGLAILAGSPKAGKSWLCLDLCLSVARGDPFWNREVDPLVGDVIYLALEDSDRRLKSRMEKVLDGRSAPSTLHFVTDAPPIDCGLVDQLRPMFDMWPNTSLVVVDTLGKIRQASGKDGYQKDYAELSAVKNLADEMGCCFLVVHHLRKMRSTDPLDMISGTNGILGAADTAFVLQRERQSTDGRLTVVGRDVDESEMLLKFTESCQWELVTDDVKTYHFHNDPLVQFLNDLPNEDGICFQGFAQELTVEFQAFCRRNKLEHGLGEIKPAISLSRRLNAIQDQLWRVGKKINTVHTNRGSLLTISPL